MKLRTLVWSTVLSAVAGIVILVALLVVGQARGWREPQPPMGRATVRLISSEQYLTAIREVFGNDIKVEASFPPVQRRQGLLALGGANAAVTAGALDQFDRTARSIAEQVTDEAHRSMLVPCAPTTVTKPDAVCARRFFARVGRLLYRRPLTERELQTQVDMAGAVAQASADFYQGLAYSLSGMLISPKFLYFVEDTESDPAHLGQIRLTAYSKATRLSLFLWDAPPDETLLNAAASGALQTRDGLRRQVDRMLSSGRTEQGVRAFFADLLAFDRFETLAKDPVIYPDFTPEVAKSVQEQTLQLITHHLLTEKRDYRDLFTTTRSFTDGTLASFYDVPVPDPQQWTPIELAPGRSAGLLTTLSFVALNAHPGRTSPTRRGRAIREFLLCQKVPDPPPNVSFSIFDDSNRHFKTARERLDAHATDPVCAGCHKLTDPAGLALENFDGAGTFRSTENGVSIDTSGNLDGKPFTNITGLGAAMRASPALGPCLASRLYAYGVGREIDRADRPWLAWLAKRFAANEYRLPDLLREIVLSPAFYAVSPPVARNDMSIVTASTALSGVSQRPESRSSLPQ